MFNDAEIKAAMIENMTDSQYYCEQCEQVIEVSKEVEAKTIKWADYGWHVRYVGPDRTHYLWIG